MTEPARSSWRSEMRTAVLACPPQKSAQRALALQQWSQSEVLAVELEQIEGPQERPAVVLAAVQAIEIGDAIVITHHHLAVDRRVRAERGRSRSSRAGFPGPSTT